MGNFTGSLNSNEIFASLYNMIISQMVFVNPISGMSSSLVDGARVDGSLYGDTKLYTSTDVLKSHAWGNDAEAANLLALDRPPAPKTQAITLNVFRQIRLTISNYLEKRAWSIEGAFGSFNGVLLSWIRETKKIYDVTTYNAFIGTHEGALTGETYEIDLNQYAAEDTEPKARLESQEIARAIKDLLDNLAEPSRDYNDNEFLRAYDMGQLKIVWNKKYLNKITYMDLPTIFHDEKLKNQFTGEAIHSRYFGEVLTASNVASYSDSTPSAGKPIDADDGKYTPGVAHANGTIRALEEADITVSGTVYHVFPGDEVPVGTVITATTINAGLNVYFELDDVICKIYGKDGVPYMSAFEVATSFFNARSLTENHYLTFGHNTLEHLKEFPFITVYAD